MKKFLIIPVLILFGFSAFAQSEVNTNPKKIDNVIELTPGRATFDSTMIGDTMLLFADFFIGFETDATVTLNKETNTITYTFDIALPALPQITKNQINLAPIVIPDAKEDLYIEAVFNDDSSNSGPVFIKTKVAYSKR